MRKVKAEVFIPLTRGKVTVLDFEDFDKVRGYKWYANRYKRNWYAVTHGYENKQTTVYMHRLLLKATKGSIVDHVNGDGLDNHLSNLRLATATQNSQNLHHLRMGKSSRFKGVYLNQGNRRWMARINKVYLGYFDSEVDAAKIYDAAARKYFGEFAKLNFPNI